MRPILITVPRRAEDPMTSGEMISRIKNTTGEFKFVPVLFVDMLETELVLVFCVSQGLEHKDLFSQGRYIIHRDSKNLRYVEGTKPFEHEDGGGYLRIEDGVLRFYGESNAFGPYKKEILKRVNPPPDLETFRRSYSQI